jgi:hypothetical protein
MVASRLLSKSALGGVALMTFKLCHKIKIRNVAQIRAERLRTISKFLQILSSAASVKSMVQ